MKQFSMSRFIEATPGLGFVGRGEVGLDHQMHRTLRAEAQQRGLQL
jgi:hypothetical protein